jgi:hypothetical protein
VQDYEDYELSKTAELTHYKEDDGIFGVRDSQALEDRSQEQESADQKETSLDVVQKVLPLVSLSVNCQKDDEADCTCYEKPEEDVFMIVAFVQKLEAYLSLIRSRVLPRSAPEC